MVISWPCRSCRNPLTPQIQLQAEVDQQHDDENEHDDTIAGAAVPMGDWVILTTNGTPTNVSMSVVAISQANASKITKIDPIPLKPGQQSTYYGHGAVDPENNRIYAMEAGTPHKAFAIDIDPNTGKMSVAWVEPEWSQMDITLIGPADKRVFVSTNMS